MKRINFILLGLLNLFIAIAAIPWQYSCLLQAGGKGIGIIVDNLMESQVSNLFRSGSILFVILGFTNLINAFLSFLKFRLAPVFGLMLGEALIMWIILQVSFFGLTKFLQPAYLIIGISQIILSYRLFKLIDKDFIH